jgi:Fic family protein
MDLVPQILQRIHEKKKKLDSYKPLPPALDKNLDEWFSMELTYTSNAIEGNTLSFDETAMVVEKGITIGGKTMKEHQEAINHANAINRMKQLVSKKRAEIVIGDILSIHRIILEKIDDAHAGCLRNVAVRILGSTVVLPNPLKVPDLMDEFMHWLTNTTNENTVITSALAHLKLVSIHPFVDGNGRTARLLMNLILLQEGYPLAIIKKENRAAYIKAIEHAQLTHDENPFLIFICQAVEHSLDEYLDAITSSNIST